jgi:hypothetical protein
MCYASTSNAAISAYIGARDSDTSIGFIDEYWAVAWCGSASKLRDTAQNLIVRAGYDDGEKFKYSREPVSWTKLESGYFYVVSRGSGKRIGIGAGSTRASALADANPGNNYSIIHSQSFSCSSGTKSKTGSVRKDPNPTPGGGNNPVTTISDNEPAPPLPPPPSVRFRIEDPANLLLQTSVGESLTAASQDQLGSLSLNSSTVRFTNLGADQSTYSRNITWKVQSATSTIEGNGCPFADITFSRSSGIPLPRDEFHSFDIRLDSTEVKKLARNAIHSCDISIVSTRGYTAVSYSLAIENQLEETIAANNDDQVCKAVYFPDGTWAPGNNKEDYFLSPILANPELADTETELLWKDSDSLEIDITRESRFPTSSNFSMNLGDSAGVLKQPVNGSYRITPLKSNGRPDDNRQREANFSSMQGTLFSDRMPEVRTGDSRQRVSIFNPCSWNLGEAKNLTPGRNTVTVDTSFNGEVLGTSQVHYDFESIDVDAQRLYMKLWRPDSVVKVEDISSISFPPSRLVNAGSIPAPHLWNYAFSADTPWSADVPWSFRIQTESETFAPYLQFKLPERTLEGVRVYYSLISANSRSNAELLIEPLQEVTGVAQHAGVEYEVLTQSAGTKKISTSQIFLHVDPRDIPAGQHTLYLPVYDVESDSISNVLTFNVDASFDSIGDEDADGDGHANKDDLCPSVAGDNDDSDGDGFGDVCDLNEGPIKTENINSPDSVGDSATNEGEDIFPVGSVFRIQTPILSGYIDRDPSNERGLWWMGGAGSTHFGIYRCESTATDSCSIVNPFYTPESTNPSLYPLTDIVFTEEEQAYFFRVVGCVGNNCTPFSNVYKYTELLPQLQLFITDYDSLGRKQPHLRWEPVNGLIAKVHYKIYRVEDLGGRFGDRSYLGETTGLEFKDSLPTQTTSSYYEVEVCNAVTCGPGNPRGWGTPDSVDTDSDGAPDIFDINDDNDGFLDIYDAFPLDSSESMDTDGDGIGNNADTDDDGDGYLDIYDDFPLDNSEFIDTDGDGIGNNADDDNGSEIFWGYGERPDAALGLAENNIALYIDRNKIMYTCIAIYTNGLPVTLEGGLPQYAVWLRLLSLDPVKFRLADAKMFNPLGWLDGEGELPDCSGRFETTTGLFSDILKVDGGEDVGRVTFSVSDVDALEFQLEAYEPIVAN